jgi:hypothetical protein
MEYIKGSNQLRALFSTYWILFRGWYKGEIREAVIENVEKMLKCRTPQLGFHEYRCPHCNRRRLIPHSCKSRFCNSCGKILTDNWTEERLSDILQVGYHHIIFTLPWQLRAIILLNRKVMLNLLFRSVKKSILDWTEQQGYTPGIYVILHTYGSDIKFNVHFHVIITSGGISKDRKRWISSKDGYLMPEKGLKKRWRYNVIHEMIVANNKGFLEMPLLKKTGKRLNLRGVISVISKLQWYIYIGTCLLDIGLTVKYVARYTKKPVLAETRIKSYDSKWAIFTYKDYADNSKIKVKKMRLFTFMSYLINHIPDKHFRIVRGYGIFSNRVKGELLSLSRELVGDKSKLEGKNHKSWQERYIEQTGQDPLICEKCQTPMELVYRCFKLESNYLSKLNIKDIWSPLPSIQFNSG